MRKHHLPTFPQSIMKSMLPSILGASALALVTFGFGVSGFGGAASADDTRATGERIESMRDTLDRWVETRRIISEEQRDWALGRELHLNPLDRARQLGAHAPRERQLCSLMVANQRSTSSSRRTRAGAVGKVPVYGLRVIASACPRDDTGLPAPAT